MPMTADKDTDRSIGPRELSTDCGKTSQAKRKSMTLDLRIRTRVSAVRLLLTT